MTLFDDSLIDDDDEPFELTAEMRAELEVSIARADRGEGIPAEQVLAELRARTERFRLTGRLDSLT